MSRSGAAERESSREAGEQRTGKQRSRGADKQGRKGAREQKNRKEDYSAIKTVGVNINVLKTVQREKADYTHTYFAGVSFSESSVYSLGLL